MIYGLNRCRKGFNLSLWNRGVCVTGPFGCGLWFQIPYYADSNTAMSYVYIGSRSTCCIYPPYDKDRLVSIAMVYV